MGFNIYFYETRDVSSRERLTEMLNDLYREQSMSNCVKLQDKIKAIERERDKYVLVVPQPKLTIYNLTNNYSIPECMSYWYGLRDFHMKTVVEAREIMLKAIQRMEQEEIVPNCLSKKYAVKTIVGHLLMWLKSNYSNLETMNDNWLIVLK